jgi:phosphate transport system permease protein
LIAALILSLSRALAETAALLFTSGYVDRMPGSIFDGGRVLSVHVFDLAMNVPGGEPNAYKSTFILLILVVMVHLLFQISFRALAHTRGLSYDRN